MTTYRAEHDSLFRTVAEILVRDYIAPSETADTVAKALAGDEYIDLLGPSELAALIADVEGYEKR